MLVIEWNTFNAQSFVCLNYIVTSSNTSDPHQSLHLSIVIVIALQFGFIIDILQKKLLSEHTSSEVTRNFVLGHLTSKRPKGDEQPTSITFPSGEAPKHGASRLTTRPEPRFEAVTLNCLPVFFSISLILSSST